MTRATMPRKPAKPKPADVCRLTLHIRGVAYAVRPFPAVALGSSAHAFRLRKAGTSEVYDVAETPLGPTCDCGDQTFRHEGIDALGCKHIRALRALGLIGPHRPEPARLPVP